MFNILFNIRIINQTNLFIDKPLYNSQHPAMENLFVWTRNPMLDNLILKYDHVNHVAL